MVTEVCHNNSELFIRIPSPFKVVRYHSWLVSSESLPACLEITATAVDRQLSPESQVYISLLAAIFLFHNLSQVECFFPVTPEQQKNVAVMAIQHTTKLLYGVQFHPESVCTEHGELLMQNFWKISADKGRPASEMVMPVMKPLSFSSRLLSPSSNVRCLQSFISLVLTCVCVCVFVCVGVGGWVFGWAVCLCYKL